MTAGYQTLIVGISGTLSENQGCSVAMVTYCARERTQLQF